MTHNQTDNKVATVLVIEDTEDNRVLITALLTRGGYRTIEAINGKMGVEMTFRECPDIILLDIQLPDIDGMEVLRQIRASKSNHSIPIIAMTSYAMAGDRDRLVAAGCTGYIEKPIDPMRVLDQIHTIIETEK